MLAIKWSPKIKWKAQNYLKRDQRVHFRWKITRNRSEKEKFKGRSSIMPILMRLENFCALESNGFQPILVLLEVKFLT